MAGIPAAFLMIHYSMIRDKRKSLQGSMFIRLKLTNYARHVPANDDYAKV
jgi:hypothetical protein